MILNNAINAGNFIYCMASWTPNESITYFNDGHGHYHKYAYILNGQGIAEIRREENGEVILRDETPREGQLLDLTPSKGMYHTTITKEHSLHMILFNPIPDTRNISVDIVKGPIQTTISTDTNRKVIVCLTGPIIANGKSLTSLQHAKILPGKTADITLPENTVCAVISDN